MNFKDCLERGSIIKSELVVNKTDESLKVALEYLEDAEKVFDTERFRLCYLSSYISLFHTARALLYSKGYNEHSHICLYIALKELYFEDKKLLVHLNQMFSYLKEREMAQYEGKEIIKEDARNILLDAQDFYKCVREHLKKK